MADGSNYAHPEVLVETDWVAQHLNSGEFKLIEIDVDTEAYAQGHIPGAIGFNWQTELEDTLRRDVPDKGQWESLLSKAGISNSDTLVLYGDNNNWFATFGYWLFVIYGHDKSKLKLINGGRKKWVAEGRELTTEVPTPTPAHVHSLRAELGAAGLPRRSPAEAGRPEPDPD